MEVQRSEVLVLGFEHDVEAVQKLKRIAIRPAVPHALAVRIEVALADLLQQLGDFQLPLRREAQLHQTLRRLRVVHGRPHAAPAFQDALDARVVRLDVAVLVNPAVMDVQHHRREVRETQTVVQAIGLFVVLEGDALARLGRQARPHGTHALGAEPPGDMQVALEVLKAPAITHHADHVGVVLEFRQAVLHHLRLVRPQHAVLAGMHRQADVVGPRQLADRGETRLEAALHFGAAVERRDLGMAVERQQVAGQPQHAQHRRQRGDVFEQHPLGVQVVLDDLLELRFGRLAPRRGHPAQRGAARVEGALDALQLLQREALLRMAIHAGEADTGHGFLVDDRPALRPLPV